MKHKSIFVFVLALSLCANSHAQESGKLGIHLKVTAGNEIGGIFHISRKIALRPSVSFERTNRERSEVKTSISADKIETTTMFGTGLSGLYYMGTEDDFAIYVGVNVFYAQLDFKSDYTGYRNEMYEAGLNGMFGAQHKLGKRASIFGEFGFGFSGENDQDSRFGTFHSKHFGVINSGIGVIFYLN